MFTSISVIARLFWRGRPRFRGSHEGQFLNMRRTHNGRQP